MADAVTAPASPPLTRREFLNYLALSSVALTLAGSAGAILWFAYPRFRAGEFGGKFPLEVDVIPQAGSGPADYPEGRFWLVNTDEGVVALYKVCVHLGCLYKWVPSNERFECPCHGSKYEVDGTYIEGPAPRSLDRFVVEFLDAEGNVLEATPTGDMDTDENAGQPLAVPAGAVSMSIDTGTKITGPARS